MQPGKSTLEHFPRDNLHQHCRRFKRTSTYHQATQMEDLPTQGGTQSFCPEKLVQRLHPGICRPPDSVEISKVTTHFCSLRYNRVSSSYRALSHYERPFYGSLTCPRLSVVQPPPYEDVLFWLDSAGNNEGLRRSIWHDR